MITDPMPLTIENAQSVKKNFLRLLEEKGSLSVHMNDITEIDLAGIQILVALVLEGASKDREIHFTGTIFPEVQSRLRLAGFNEEFCATGEKFELAIKAACQ